MSFVYPFNGGLPVVGPYSDVAIAAAAIVWKRTKSTTKMVQAFTWFMSFGVLGEPNHQFLEETGTVDAHNAAHDEVRHQLIKSIPDVATTFDPDVVEDCQRVLEIVRTARTKMSPSTRASISARIGPEEAIDRAFDEFVPMVLRVHSVTDPIKQARYTERMNDILVPHANRFENLLDNIEGEEVSSDDTATRVMKMLGMIS